MTPNEAEMVEVRAKEVKERMGDAAQRKEAALRTTIGRGLLFIAMGLIKQRRHAHHSHIQPLVCLLRILRVWAAGWKT